MWTDDVACLLTAAAAQSRKYGENPTCRRPLLLCGTNCQLHGLSLYEDLNPWCFMVFIKLSWPKYNHTWYLFSRHHCLFEYWVFSFSYRCRGYYFSQLLHLLCLLLDVTCWMGLLEPCLHCPVVVFSSLSPQDNDWEKQHSPPPMCEKSGQRIPLLKREAERDIKTLFWNSANSSKVTTCREPTWSGSGSLRNAGLSCCSGTSKCLTMESEFSPLPPFICRSYSRSRCRCLMSPWSCQGYRGNGDSPRRLFLWRVASLPSSHKAAASRVEKMNEVHTQGGGKMARFSNRLFRSDSTFQAWHHQRRCEGNK